MLRIAICDDAEIICIKIENIILQYQEKELDRFEIEVFYSGEELIRFIESDHSFDLLFLDIELKSIDGIEVGRIIREEMGNEEMQIIYISGQQNYAMDLFENRPLQFLIKPLQEKIIISYLEKAIKLTYHKNEGEYLNGIKEN